MTLLNDRINTDQSHAGQIVFVPVPRAQAETFGNVLDEMTQALDSAAGLMFFLNNFARHGGDMGRIKGVFHLAALGLETIVHRDRDMLQGLADAVLKAAGVEEERA
ncbi:hypothetical protein [Pseudogemmobacter bohemicus]|uniref:hypothetical protein n=1 Tax=Pseudogemmobacter bohemicus TaxID=2250708 RepID=UPI000DD3F22A|nr:hypothetical protein [Pseudogemmobacter bohemicus]